MRKRLIIGVLVTLLATAGGLGVSQQVAAATTAATTATAAATPVTVVDQWSGFSSTSDTTDGVHPNDSGNVKISSKWYPALTPLLASGASSRAGAIAERGF